MPGLICNGRGLPENSSLWHGSCSKKNRHARKTQSKGWKCPRRHHFSERRLPLRQPPAERPFSASPRNWNPVRNDWVLPLLGINYFQFISKSTSFKFQVIEISGFFGFRCQSLTQVSLNVPGLYAMVAVFQKILRCGTQAALRRTGTHGRPKVKVGSAPAAITSLSAACRCASHPPSDPSVLPPEIGTQSEMTGFSCI